MNRITNITKRDILNTLLYTTNDMNLLTYDRVRFNMFGMCNPLYFIDSLYDLNTLPSKNKKYKNCREELFAVANNYNYEDYVKLLLDDERFQIFSKSDEELLRFLCYVFHPEVRDEQKDNLVEPLWNTVLNSVNLLLQPDGYYISVDGTVSGRWIYSWIDARSQNLDILTQSDISPFLNLIYRDGTILDFTPETFEDFTAECIGERLSIVYNCRNQRSCRQFLMMESEEKVISFLVAIYNYYVNHERYSSEVEKKKGHYSNEYYKCKKVIEKIGYSSLVKRTHLKKVDKFFSSQYVSESINRMLDMEEKNPAESIGKAKELIETCCKTILDKKAIEYDKEAKVHQLAKKTIKALVGNESEESNEVIKQAIKMILGPLSTITHGVSQLRNEIGTGHGKSASFSKVNPRYAKLATGAAETFVSFIIATYEDSQKQKKSSSQD